MSYTLKQKQDFAKEMRENMTDAERLLWSRINNRQLGHRFIRQGLVWGYIPDFYCPKARLMIEVDGSVHDLQAEKDRAKDQAMAEYGIAVLRFTNKEVQEQLAMVLQDIKRECEHQVNGALKAFSSGPLLAGTSISNNSRACESLRKSGNFQVVSRLKDPASVEKVWTSAKRVPATLEDWREIGEKLALLYRRKSVNVYKPPFSQQAWEQRYRLAEYAKRKEQASVRTTESPESAQTGTDAETPTTNNLGERIKQG